jgi:hypothetical protein
MNNQIIPFISSNPAWTDVFSCEPGTTMIVDAVSRDRIAPNVICQIKETAVWAYNMMKTRPYYWRDKRTLFARIFRTVNISVFKRCPLYNNDASIEANAALIIQGKALTWIGVVGKIYIWHIHHGKAEQLYPDEISPSFTEPIGKKRYAFVPAVFPVEVNETSSFCFASGDMIPVAVSMLHDQRVVSPIPIQPDERGIDVNTTKGMMVFLTQEQCI